MRSENEADHGARTARNCAIRRVCDPRRPVLHAREHRHVAQLALERGAGLFRDRVQRRLVLDPEAAVAPDQIVEQLAPDRPATANVGVVRRNVCESLRRPVRHQDDRSLQTRASTVAS